MKIRKIRRKALSALLTLAIVFTFMPFVTYQAHAAGNSSVQLVTKAKTNNGNTTYKYNKKGLVTKAVTKYSSKGEAYDESRTETTSYKYNKKNRISKATTKVVTTTTSYDTNKTTGKNNGTILGKVTTTDTYVTKYTYKGTKVKKSVTTITRSKSGSEKDNYKNRSLYSEGELTNGKVIAGYNEYDATGKLDYEETSAKAYYYTGAVNAAVSSGTDTTTYTPVSGGYKETYDSSSSYANYTRTRNRTYYKYDSNNKVVPGTEDDYDFYITNSVNITLDPANNTSSTSHSETVYQDKTVVTTKYTYKKGRVSKTVATTVHTVTEKDVTSSESSKDGSETYTWKDNTPSTRTFVDTDVVTTSYTYKNGLVSKTVSTNKGVENHTETYAQGLPNRTYYYSDGTTESRVGSGATYDYVRNTVVKNGTKTVTYTPYKYKLTYTSNGSSTVYDENEDEKATTETSAVKATPSKSTTKYIYDKNKNLKKAVTTGDESEVEDRRNETFGNVLYEFDSAGKAIVATTVVKTNFKKTVNKETGVKKGTKRLNKSLSMTTSSYGRRKASGYGLSGRVVYTLKAKKLSSKISKVAEQQQWILQNGNLNGVAGLF